MSDETIDYLNRNTLIGYTVRRGTAWHYRKGTNNHYPGPIPVEDVKSRLFDWEPISTPVSAVLDDGTVITDHRRQALLRPDTEEILGVFKSTYTPHPYGQWLVDSVESILDADLQIGSAGLLANGARAWVQVEMQDTMQTENVDFRPYLTAATSMDGSLSTTYQTGAQVVVCDNTLSLALRETTSKYRVKHTRNSNIKISEARDALRIMAATASEVSARIERLATTPVTTRQWTAFLDAYTAPSSNSTRANSNASDKRAQLARLYDSDHRVAPWAGTAWGVLSAANTWAHHYQAVRGTSRPERNLDRMVQGQYAKIDNHTLHVLAKAASLDLSDLDLAA